MQSKVIKTVTCVPAHSIAASSILPLPRVDSHSESLTGVTFTFIRFSSVNKPPSLDVPHPVTVVLVHPT